MDLFLKQLGEEQPEARPLTQLELYPILKPILFVVAIMVIVLDIIFVWKQIQQGWWDWSRFLEVSPYNVILISLPFLKKKE